MLARRRGCVTGCTQEETLVCTQLQSVPSPAITAVALYGPYQRFTAFPMILRTNPFAELVRKPPLTSFVIPPGLSVQARN